MGKTYKAKVTSSRCNYLHIYLRKPKSMKPSKITMANHYKNTKLSRLINISLLGNKKKSVNFAISGL